MEINTNNLLDNIVYRANIFNYDSKFLAEFKKRDLKLDLNLYFQVRRQQSSDQVATAIQFLNQKSKDQLCQILALLSQKEEENFDEDVSMEGNLEESEEFVNTNRKLEKLNLTGNSKNARTTFMLLIDALMFSKNQFTASEAKRLADLDEMNVDEIKSSIQTKSVFADNILYILLYLDGLVMFNIDIIKKLDMYAPLLGSNLIDVLFDIINDTFLDGYTKEVSSHLLSSDLAFVNSEGFNTNKWKELMYWTYDYYLQSKRESCLTANLSLILTHDPCVEFFISQFDSEKRSVQDIFNLMIKENNYNTIYESVFCVWNISNDKKTINLFENKNDKYLEKIIQVIKTNKIDKIARIGLMTIRNLLSSQTCVEILLDIKFMRTIDILLTNKWNDPVIKEQLNFIYDFLEKNYKIMNSFEKFVKELESGNLKWGSLHTTSFWEDNYKDFEFNNFEHIKMLVRILQNPNNLTDQDIEMKCIACFDLGEFARLYPGGASILDYFGAKDSLLFLITHNNLELKNRALVCLQKIMMRSLKK